MLRWQGYIYYFLSTSKAESLGIDLDIPFKLKWITYKAHSYTIQYHSTFSTGTVAITAMNRLNLLLGRMARSKPYLRESGYNLLIFASWIPAVVFFNENVGEVHRITGASMYPYLNTNYNEGQSKDLCWVNKWNAGHNLQRGMLVSFWYVCVFPNSQEMPLTGICRSPFNPESLAIKRIIAVEGDVVYPRAPYPSPIAKIPAGHVWVEGDNREKQTSLDSNYYGPIPINLIQGKVTNILWPWASSGPIRWWEFKGKTRVVKGRKEDAPQWA